MMFKIDKIILLEAKQSVVSIRCPSCRQRGTFEPTLTQDVAYIHSNTSSIILGQRRCPDPDCHAHIFVAYDRTNKSILVSYPPERIDFDSTAIPASILETLEEAISCHAAQCYVASAIMIRKTLEELCADQGAAGQNLKEKLDILKTKVVMPVELLEGLHDLRLLGNDAAHLVSKIYDKVDQDEVEIAIEITKEILKGVYQYSTLIKKLQNLKK